MPTPTSPFVQIPQALPDPILGLTEAFNSDDNPNKVNLGVGVYQNSDGKVPLLKVVLEAERRWLEKEETKSYLPIDGAPAYNKAVQGLLFGAESSLISEGRAVTVQGLGGTGGLKIGADFLRRFFPSAEIWISSPSWENHQALFEAAGFRVESYPYYNPETHGLDFAAMLAGMKEIPQGNIVVLHACCHNPTGVDLNEGQWNTVVDLFKHGSLIPYLDFAYQGFGNGIDQDAYAVRAFADAGIPCLIASSFSKSFSMYRERVGALTVITNGVDESKRVLSQLKRTIRTNYSSPSSNGAQVIALILSDQELRAQWEVELAEMRERIHKMRSLFVKTLKGLGVPRDFSFIERQNGMFSYSGLSKDMVKRLRSEYSLYIVESGRICVAAMNERNMPYICEAIAKVVE
jgi:aromatic-amino-acid transaminase